MLPVAADSGVAPATGAGTDSRGGGAGEGAGGARMRTVIDVTTGSKRCNPGGDEPAVERGEMQGQDQRRGGPHP